MVQLGLLRSTLVYFSPLWSHSVHFGLLQSIVVPFSPIWSTGEIFFPQMLCLGRELTKTEYLGKKKFPQQFKNKWSHGTIHAFKNYFITIFSVFSKINGIQTDFTLSMPFFIQSFKPLLKYLVSQIRYCKRSKERTG